MVAVEDFDLMALYHALDAERAARQLRWGQAAREISTLKDPR